MGQRIADCIRVSSLFGIIVGTHQTQRPLLRRLPFQTNTPGTTFLVIGLLVGKGIGEIAVAPAIIGRKGIAEFLPYLRIAGKGVIAGTVRSVGDRGVHSLKLQGGFGIYVDDPSHRITSV